MLTVYRMCNIASTNPSPIFQEDKRKLNELCLKSFVEAFKEVNPKMYFILDHCPSDYVDMIGKIVPFEFDFEMTSMGINATMLRSYELARDSDEEILLLAECDYIWRPGIGKDFEIAIKALEVVSPYDHPDFYTRPDIHPSECKVALIDNQHYRTAWRNTMTFGITRQALLNNFESFMYWGYLDNDIWAALRKLDYPLWTPLPSFATHCVANYMASGVNWKEIWEKYI